MNRSLIRIIHAARPGGFRLALLGAVALARLALASDHPGNVFVVGDDVTIALPAAWAEWRAIDVEGNSVGQGTARGRLAALGKLPTGYYEVRQSDGPAIITAAVLAKSTFSQNTPIAVDTGVSWFYADAEQLRDACALCRLAGVTWVRDRLSWPEIETARGDWAPDGRYERAMRIEHESGLKILQVNHISPPWATDNPSRFPDDLRDVYNFYHGLAERWQGLVDAIEPWNEPDIKLFGGHTGCEIASFQKAAYLGLKAGNPQLPVCQSAFAIDRSETLDEFGANEAYPYFDRYNLHHYIGLPVYPRAYARHRAVSGGRPMWTTEFNLPVHWANEDTKEPSDEELRVQAFRVGKVFAVALHEGIEKAFYFILGDYVERNLQYGLVHKDLTPRPAYVAFAAVGRLLNGAVPIGRVDLGDEKLKAYAFKTVVDGEKRETLVAWSETVKTPVEIQTAVEAYDYLGRELTHARKVELTRETVFLLLPPGGATKLKVELPPKMAKWRSKATCPVVLQLLGNGDVDRSAFRLNDTRELRLVAYNFGEQTAVGTWNVMGATGLPATFKLSPGGRETWTITAVGPKLVSARLDLGDLGQAVVSARLLASESPRESIGKAE